MNCEWQRHLGVGPIVLRDRGGIRARTRSRRSTVKTRLVASTVFALGAFAQACSSSGGASPVTSAVAPPVTAVAPSTTFVPSSVPTSASIATTMPATTVATTAVAAPIEAAVRAGFAASQAAYNAAVADLASFDPSAIRGTHAPPLVDSVIGNIQILIDKGWRTRPGPVGDYYVIESVTINDSARATVRACAFSDGVLFDPHGGGPEIIVNAEAVSRVEDREMVLEGGVWKNSDVTEIDKKVGLNTCPAKP